MDGYNYFLYGRPVFMKRKIFHVLLVASPVLGFSFVHYGPWTIKRVEGPSMRPTLNPDVYVYDNDQPQSLARSLLPRKSFDDVVLVRKIRTVNAENASKHLVGKIVLVKHPKKPDVTVVKRLKAVVSDEESHPRGWVESDAGHGYADSTQFGPVRLHSIVGEVLCVLWPKVRLLRDSDSLL